MIITTKKIYTEDPESELWKMFSKYTYDNNLIRHFNAFDPPYSPLGITVNTISGSLLQSAEFFKSAKSASLQTSPILIYYGTINLFQGICALLTGSQPRVTDHGMKLFSSGFGKNKLLADSVLKIENEKTGGVSVFLRHFDPSCASISGYTWNLKELLSSIPDLFDDFMELYSSESANLIPVETVNEGSRTLERIEMNVAQRFEDIRKSLLKCNGYKENYLNPTITSKYVILNRKNLFTESVFQYGITNRRFLTIPYEKDSLKFNLPLCISMLMALFVLCSICRYRPNIWNPFVNQDSTGEKLIIEKFLDSARRFLPNLLLDQLLGKRHIFINELFEPTNLNSPVTKDMVNELVQKEIANLRIQLRKDSV